jgi:hypothetical protein
LFYIILLKVLKDYIHNLKCTVNQESPRNGSGRNKFRVYKTFKNNFETDNNSMLVLNRSHRGALAKFCSGTAELGRYNGLPVEAFLQGLFDSNSLAVFGINPELKKKAFPTNVVNTFTT